MSIMSPFCLYLIFIPLTINIHTNAQIITRSATLNTSQINHNGASIQTQRIDSTDNNGWTVNVNTNLGYHWKISLDDTWKFPLDSVSNLTLDVYSDLVIGQQESDIMLSFSQNNETYFTTFIALIAGNTNKIYPDCDTSNQPSQSFAEGDINNLLNQNNGYRAAKSTQGDDWDFLGPLDIDFPLNIKLTNNLIDGWSKWEYTNPTATPWKDSCGFEPFSADYPLDIFIYGSLTGQVLSIKSFDLTFEYVATSTSTENPTEHPTETLTTQYPSAQPSGSLTSLTESPSSLPTHEAVDLPSNNPTSYASSQPTVPFTGLPTTYSPSSPPEHIATEYLTVNPSELPSALSTYQSPDDKESVPDTVTDEQRGDEGATLSDSMYLIIAVSAGSCCLVICCIGFIFCTKKKRNKQREVDTKTSAVKVNSVSPVLDSNSPTMNSVVIGDNQFTMDSAEKEDESNVAMVASFEANLNNLQAANVMLMDDVVDDMEMRGEDDEQANLAGNATKGGSDDMELDASEGDDDSHDKVIGGFETMG